MRLVMMGTGSFAQPTFEALVGGEHQVVALVTQPDRAVGQQLASTRLATRSLKEIAIQRQIPVLEPENVNTPEGAAQLQSFEPDLLVVAAYGQILSRDVLATAKHGGINVHASLLPKYRGAAPIAWAIYHGETRTGVSIIRMSIHLDAGDILAQEAFDILPEETAGELETRLGPLGARLALETVNRIETGPIAGTPQDKSKVTKAPKLTKELGLIDWSRSAEQICRHVRAMQPWPTAYTFLNRVGQQPLRMILCRTQVNHGVSIESGLGIGEARCVGKRLFSGAGERGSVEIMELQPAGKRRMQAAEFLRGYPLRQGDQFGLAATGG